MFGDENEELSEIEEFDSPTRNTTKTRTDKGDKISNNSVPLSKSEAPNEPDRSDEVRFFSRDPLAELNNIKFVLSGYQTDKCSLRKNVKTSTLRGCVRR